jgi:hypothetical protein
VAVKKVQGGRILGATWKNRVPQGKAAVTLARRQNQIQGDSVAQRKSEIEPR